MKRLYNLLLCILSLGVLLSCSDPAEEQPAEPASLQLLDKLVTVEPEGGEVVVGYVITNPDGSEISARCEDEWCHSFEFPEDGMMTFIVDANEGVDSRIANVYIKYGDIEEKFTLSQAYKGEDLEAIATMDFDISYRINGPEVKMTVKPEFNNVRYYFAYSTKAEIDNIAPDKLQAVIKANVQSFLQGEVNAMVNYSGYTITQALDEYTGYATRSATMTINARTDYVGWACAISNEVTVISDVVMKEFRTGDVPPSDNQISITIDDVNCDRVSFSTHTTNEDQYATYVLPADQVEGRSDEELVALFNTSPDVTVYLHFGDYSATQVGLSADSEYYVLAYGYKWGMATTEICREKFRTVTYEGGDASFTFNVEKLTNISMIGNVECSVPTHLYYTDYCYPGDTAEEILSDLEEAIDWYVNDAGYYSSRIELMRVIGTRGTHEFSYDNRAILPDNGYVLYAIAIDETTGEFCSDVVFSEIYTTPGVSDVTVNAYYDHYFDAITIAEMYPESEYVPEYVNGYAVVPLLVETNDDIADYYVDIFNDDLSDTSYPSDDQLFNSLYTAGQHNNSPVFILCDFFDMTKTPLTISAVAIDKDGNRGPVQRTVFETPYSGCADPAEFAQYLQAASISSVKAVEPEVLDVRKPRVTRLETLINKDRNE